MCQEAHRPGRSEDNFWCLLLFFEARLFYVSLISVYLYVGLRSQTQVTRLGWQALLSSEPSHRPCWFSFIVSEMANGDISLRDTWRLVENGTQTWWLQKMEAFNKSLLIPIMGPQSKGCWRESLLVTSRHALRFLL